MRLIPEKGERRGDSLISPHIGVARRAGRPLITCERGSAGSTGSEGSKGVVPEGSIKSLATSYFFPKTIPSALPKRKKKIQESP